MTHSSARIEMIPISDIAVTNPRVRNAKIHKTITESIDQVGLKRPITVRRVPRGQGRLESCKMLGQTEIAALVVGVDEETGHVMSIVEIIDEQVPGWLVVAPASLRAQIPIIQVMRNVNNPIRAKSQFACCLEGLGRVISQRGSVKSG